MRGGVKGATGPEGVPGGDRTVAALPDSVDWRPLRVGSTGGSGQGGGSGGGIEGGMAAEEHHGAGTGARGAVGAGAPPAVFRVLAGALAL